MGKAETNSLLALLQAEGACQDTDLLNVLERERE